MQRYNKHKNVRANDNTAESRYMSKVSPVSLKRYHDIGFTPPWISISNPFVENMIGSFIFFLALSNFVIINHCKEQEYWFYFYQNNCKAFHYINIPWCVTWSFFVACDKEIPLFAIVSHWNSAKIWHVWGFLVVICCKNRVKWQ